MCVLEALAVGIPVMATNVGGISEVITEKNGYLIEKRDAYSIYENLKKVILNIDEYKVKAYNCIEYFDEKFTLKYMNDRYMELYFN